MSGKRAVSGKTVVVFVCIGIGVGILVGALFGWHYSIVGLGAALGPWVGAYFGNKKAREVDQYRDELIQGGRRQQRSDGSAG
jgi:H+/Cl- antiporter ClcA